MNLEFKGFFNFSVLTRAMTTNRIEAFSDGVLAIVITIMVLGMKNPEGYDWDSLKSILPSFIAYIISFIYVGIYWNNHHHLFQTIKKVNGKMLWANLSLLFFLSLLPLTTAWMGEHVFEKIPVMIYGINLAFCAIAFLILVKAALSFEGKNSKLAKTLPNRNKEIASVIVYMCSIILANFIPIISLIGYTLVAFIWLIPDTRIEKFIDSEE